MLSNPWFNNNSLLNSPTSFKISGEKVTKSGFKPSSNFNFSAIDVESFPPDHVQQHHNVH